MQTLSLQAIRTGYPDVFPDILKQLNQQHCSRCGGMMVGETCMDIFSDYEEFQFQAQHCIQCGEVIDPFILLNRLKSQRSNMKWSPAIRSVKNGNTSGNTSPQSRS
jgi:ribosomal protein S27AE